MSISIKQSAFIKALRDQHPHLARHIGLQYPMTGREASTYIETMKVECLNLYGNRAGSKRALISDRIVAGKTDAEIMDMLGNEYGYGDYQRTIEFSANVNGRRIPKSMDEQKRLMADLIADLRADLSRRNIALSEEENSTEEEETTEVTETQEDAFTGTHHPLLAKIREVRAEETRRSEVEGKRTPILESVSGLRPAKNGAKALKAGIPTEAVLHALAMDWPTEARSRYGIREYDITNFKADAAGKWHWEPKRSEEERGKHPAYDYVRRAVDARIPIAAIGPSGTGKSTLFTQMAKDMNLSYGMIPCNAGVTPSWFVGAYVLDPENPYRSRSAMDMFREGGILVLEEFDAIDPNIALLANNLIENEVFENPVTGEKIKRHPDFIPVCCMNTRGLGATATNTGRSRLDDATRNRFAIGRFELFLSEDLEEEVFYGILNG